MVVERLGGTVFFQEHPENTGLHGTDPALWPGHEPAFAFESAEDLVAAAQLGMVEIHTWNSTAGAILLPDRMIFDLDPGQGVTWDQTREAALLVRALLGGASSRSLARATGSAASSSISCATASRSRPARPCRRARPGLGVAMPVGWEDLPQLTASAHWTIATAVEHLRRQRVDPWAGYWKSRQRLRPAMDRLGLA